MLRKFLLGGWKKSKWGYDDGRRDQIKPNKNKPDENKPDENKPWTQSYQLSH